MKFYVDEKGNRYRVDRETGEKTLIEKAKSKPGNDGGPKKTAAKQED